MQLDQQRPTLLLPAVLKDTLQHPARVAVRRQRKHMTPERRRDKVNRIRVEALNDLLHHVICVLVLDALHNVAIQLLRQTHPLRLIRVVERLLHHPAAVRPERKRKHVALHLLGQCSPLQVCTVLEHLLDHLH